DLTLTRIRRGLFSLLLELKKSEAEAAPSYARLLGFQKSAEPLLSEIKRKSSIPLISKDADARLLLRKDLRASEVYRMILEKKSGRKIKNDLQQPLIILN
ncbi:MAG: nucleotidyltransferase family protein, partial [Lachnospiraceae bacterium]|nr:nucleotidyltransferase family protein [Lachnospiraceae bacterium]